MLHTTRQLPFGMFEPGRWATLWRGIENHEPTACQGADGECRDPNQTALPKEIHVFMSFFLLRLKLYIDIFVLDLFFLGPWGVKSKLGAWNDVYGLFLMTLPSHTMILGNVITAIFIILSSIFSLQLGKKPSGDRGAGVEGPCRSARCEGSPSSSRFSEFTTGFTHGHEYQLATGTQCNGAHHWFRTEILWSKNGPLGVNSLRFWRG